MSFFKQGFGVVDGIFGLLILLGLGLGFLYLCLSFFKKILQIVGGIISLLIVLGLGLGFLYLCLDVLPPIVGIPLLIVGGAVVWVYSKRASRAREG